MEQIIVVCSKISKTIFPCTIDSVEYGSLTDFVHKVTRNAEMPFSASLSNLDHRKTLVYTCTFSSSGCQAQLAFTHSTDFYNNHLFTFDIQNCIFQHTNHLLNHHFVQFLNQKIYKFVQIMACLQPLLNLVEHLLIQLRMLLGGDKR